MPEFSNQYGINLAAIDQAVSAKKTAEQNMETNALRKDMLSRQNNKEIAIDKAEQDYRDNPLTAKAASLAQELQFHSLNKVKQQEAIDNKKIEAGNTAVMLTKISKLPDDNQKIQAINTMLASLPADKQKEFIEKNGTTPQEWLSKIPTHLNEALLTYGGAEELQKQAEEKTKQENLLAIEGFKHTNRLDEEGVKQKNVLTKQKQEQEFRRGENRYIQGVATERAKMQVEHADERARYRVDNPPPARPLDPLHRERFEYQKQKDAEGVRKQRIKNAEDMADLMPNYSELSGKEQKEAKQFYIRHGKLPAVTAEEGKVYGTNYKLKRSTPKKAQATDPLGIR